MDFAGQRVLIIGMARSGLAAASVLNKRGAQITICDQKNLDYFTEKLNSITETEIKIIAGGYPEVHKGDFDLVVVSPGIPLDIPPIAVARKENIPIIGEVELAYLIKKADVEMYAITGTNGKTTTTSLLELIMTEDGRDSVSGGNIGTPLATLVDNMTSGVISVEVSSFQLETINKFRPHICGILNITPDHLDRHKTMELYVKAKSRIFENQTENDYVVLNYEDSILRELAQKCQSQVVYFSTEQILPEGAFVEYNKVIVLLAGNRREICSIDEIRLRGKHNLENVLCAVLMATLAGVESGIIRKCLMGFAGVRHRMEEVPAKNGVLYINDSKATNPESAIKAISSFVQPIILIAGGRNKGSSFTNFASVIKNKVKDLVLVGEAREEIKRAVIEAGFVNIHEVEDFNAAVLKAIELADTGDVVLLSPACASWDMFDNYEQRGDLFCKIVNSISSKQNYA
ncbi:MAG: UDP-N-acetylmuramoyl-L-alanine--D-glutamate ligase [Syntrophomonadaceae bacterium]|nr:UDP-N-acetylmuramoyl-L-alanine--D-glutamate ligase [Syntrophomonadaceae bacterium]MDD3888770.1 UDP-N-acetylmuramoyl-L-alanine--D-glutamate ligase [Syntrophomonadaceae bacterium]MDD4548195.1 UDP-N-acetylmuramoyl-L-alanine--D-glutamate ligase [Syntrophomonadaceae bacterium]